MSRVRYLFLDIDGVLNHTGTPGAWRSLGKAGSLEPELVARVAGLVRELGLTVVLSSTWRRGSTGFHDTVRALYQVGWTDVRDHLKSATPELPNTDEGWAPPRGREISTWLKINPPGQFVILDDDQDMEGLGNRLVRTSYETGVTEYDCDKVREMFGVPRKSPAGS